MPEQSFNIRDQERGKRAADYWPLLVLIAICALGAYAISLSAKASMLGSMHYFMGLFLINFAMLKLFNPSSFADGFQMYDLLAKRSRAYAYVYPYIELALGLGYLSFAAPPFVYVVTMIVFMFGAFGVLQALQRGLDINCPCMGSILNVPLSTVTLTEDVTMALMAAVMLLNL